MAAQVRIGELFPFPWCLSCLCTLDGRVTTNTAIRDPLLNRWVRSLFFTFVRFCRVELRCWSLGPGKRPAQTTAAYLTRSQSQPRSSNLGCCAVTVQVKAHTYRGRNWIFSYHIIHEPSEELLSHRSVFLIFSASWPIQTHLIFLERKCV